MELQFKPFEIEDLNKIAPFYALRPNKTCDNLFWDCLIWKDSCRLRYVICEGKALLFLMEQDGEPFSVMPMCVEEDLPYYFQELTNYFNHTLKKPLRIFLADAEAVHYLNLDRSLFEVEEKIDLRDYLYEGNKLRELSGKKLRKKKAHIHAFLKEYEKRYEYRQLFCSDRGEIDVFLKSWFQRKLEVPECADQIEEEMSRIYAVLNNCPDQWIRMGGIFVDGFLKAVAMGTYNPYEDMGIIHIEKADPAIRGLYQFINQQFLIHGFTENPILVNREDDMGLEGLRKAKLSYDPLSYAPKYQVIQRGWGKDTFLEDENPVLEPFNTVKN